MNLEPRRKERSLKHIFEKEFSLFYQISRIGIKLFILKKILCLKI